MRRCALLLILLAGCTSEAERAEQQVSLIENSGGSGNDLCEAKKKVADAYLNANDAEHYKTAKLYADTTCSLAQLDPEYGMMGEKAHTIEPDNMDAIADDASNAEASAIMNGDIMSDNMTAVHPY